MPHALTTLGQTRINELKGLEQPLLIDRMILALIPDQDPEAEVDRSQQMPDAENIVYTHVIEAAHKGYITPDQVVYSMVLGSNIGNFSFNWIGTIEQGTDTVISVITTPETPKWQTNIGENITGNIITRNAMMSYQDAQSLTGITITAEWWQFDFETSVADAVAAGISAHKEDQLDPTDDDETKDKHLSNAQAKVWQDHIAREIDPEDTDETRNKHVSNHDSKQWTDHLTDEDIHQTLEIQSGSGGDGALVELAGMWKSMPAVGIVSARGLSTYTPVYSGVEQTLDYFIQDLEEYNPGTGLAESGTGYWRFTLRAYTGAADASGPQTSANVSNTIIGMTLGEKVFTWSPYVYTEYKTTPLNCISITPAGNWAASYVNGAQTFDNYDLFGVEIDIEISGVGTYTLYSSTIPMGAGRTSASRSGSFLSSAITVPSGQYSYRFRIRSGRNSWMAIGSADMTRSLSSVSSYLEVPGGGGSAAGTMGWKATGLRRPE